MWPLARRLRGRQRAALHGDRGSVVTAHQWLLEHEQPILYLAQTNCCILTTMMHITSIKGLSCILSNRPKLSAPAVP